MFNSVLVIVHMRDPTVDFILKLSVDFIYFGQRFISAESYLNSCLIHDQICFSIVYQICITRLPEMSEPGCAKFISDSALKIVGCVDILVLWLSHPSVNQIKRSAHVPCKFKHV